METLNLRTQEGIRALKLLANAPETSPWAEEVMSEEWNKMSAPEQDFTLRICAILFPQPPPG